MRSYTVGGALFILCAAFGQTVFGQTQAWAEASEAHVSQDRLALAEKRPAHVAPGRAAPVSTAVSEGESEEVARINAWTVGIVSGMLQGALIRFATDIQIVLDDGDEMRVLPIVSRGAKQNIYDLLYLKGVDVAITYSDVFEEFKKENKISNIAKRVNYISQVQVSGVHILARPEIKSLQDLQGKKVGFHGAGTGVAVTAPIVFERSGVKVEPIYVNNAVALEKMKTGEVAALVHLLPKGDAFIGKISEQYGFHLLPVEYDDKFSDYYIPFSLASDDYPKMIKPGERLETLGVPAVLAVYPWPRGTDRHRKVERFIQYYFSRFEKLKKPPYQPEWKTINLNASVPGWTRYWVAQEMLDKSVQDEAASGKAGGRGEHLSASAEPGGEALPPEVSASKSPEQERLFKEFLEWKKQQGRP